MAIYSKKDLALNEAGDKQEQISVQSPVKKKISKKGRRARRRMQMRILCAAGLICMLFAAIGIGILVRNQKVEAAAETLTKVEWDAVFPGIVFKDHTAAAESGIELYKNTSYQSGQSCQYVAYVTNVEQFKHVQRGLRENYYDENSGSKDRVFPDEAVEFRLTSNLTYEYGSNTFGADYKMMNGNNDAYQFYQSASKADWSAFVGDTFNGQGNTITIKGTSGVQELISPSSLNLVHYRGFLFGYVSNAKICNLNVEFNMNKTFEFRAQSSNYENKSLGIGIGIVCGGANNATFEDIRVYSTDDTSGIVLKIKDDAYEYKNNFAQAASGSILGCAETNVVVKRCINELSHKITFEYESDAAYCNEKYTWATAGGIVGQAVGADNTIMACVNTNTEMTKGTVPSGGPHDYWTNAAIALTGEILGMAGGLEGNALESSADSSRAIVTIEDCVITTNANRAVAAVKKHDGTAEYDPFARVIYNNLRYVKASETGVTDAFATKAVSFNYDQTYGGIKLQGSQRPDSAVVDSSDIDGDKKNWYYDSENDLHLLKDNYVLNEEEGCSQEVYFPIPELLDLKGTNKQITVKATLINWCKTEVTKNAVAELYVTWDGSDPRLNGTKLANLTGHPSGASENAILLTPDSQEELRYAGEDITIRAAVKITVNGTGMKPVNAYWSEVSERTYTAIDALFEEPVIKMQEETETEFSAFVSNHVYGLGTTKMQLSPAEGNEYSMYYSVQKTSGLQIGDTAVAGQTITLEQAKENVYSSPFTLMENMLSGTDSNKIFLYVLAVKVMDGQEYYQLYEYEIIAYKKDTLMYADPGNGSRVPNGAEIVFRVGNKKPGEYPFSSMRILVSDTKLESIPDTLEGVTGVVYGGSQESDAQDEDIKYLTCRQRLTGKSGNVFYIYVQPIVNTDNAPEGALSYADRYTTFVQLYTYTIMGDAASAVLSPASVKMTESGEVTSVQVDSQIYITASSPSDLILFNTEGTPITPEVLQEQSEIEKLEERTDLITNEQITYYKDRENKTFYVKCNEVWYSIADADDNLKVYRDGALSFDRTHENSDAYVSVIVFSTGYGPSANDIYRYHVQELGAVAPPSALLASGSSVSMGRILNFVSEENTIIYYTTDGREPVVNTGSDKKTVPGEGTLKYSAADGIVLSEPDFSYGQTVTLKMIACPVEDADATDPVFNEKKKQSDSVTFTYTILEQNQVEAPAAFPETSLSNPTQVKNGDKIALTTATSDAEIFYTTDGNTPDVNNSAQKYNGVITVDGNYGGFFNIKAVAHKAGMKDSAVVDLIYQIAEQETVGTITATPGTSTQVIAGDKIILSAMTPDAQIFYTLNGTTPQVQMSVSGNDVTYSYLEPTVKYDPSNPIVVPEGKGFFTINAIAVKPEMADSEMIQLVYSYAGEVGAPYGNPTAGTVTENTEVILESSTKGAVIYYEIAYGKEPSQPTVESAVFSEKAPIIIKKDTVIKAFAMYDRKSSATVTLKYTLAEKMQKPSPSLSSGAVVVSGTQITFPVSDGTVYYTMDGSDPSDNQNAKVNSGSSLVITGKPGDMITINACTRKTGAATSEVVTWSYQISQYPGGVKADKETGSVVSEGDIVYLTTDVTNGTIYYTTGSGNPASVGTAGNSVVMNAQPGEEVSLKAIAVAPGTAVTGSYASFIYKMMEQLAAPFASIQTNTILTEETNLVLKANKGKIYFTIDGTIPTRSSYLYEYPIVIYKDTIVQAIAVADDYEDSEVAIFVYAFAEPVKELRASKPSGIVDAGEVIELSADSTDAEIYYTTNGTLPDPDAEEGTFLYNSQEGIRINRDVTIKAIAVQKGKSNSDVLSVTYTVSDIPAQKKKLEAEAAEAAGGLQELNADQLEDRWSVSDNSADEKQIEIYDVFSDVLVQGSNSVLTEEMKLTSKEIAISGEAEQKVKNLLGNEYQFINNYEFSLYKGGSKVQPEKKVTVGIPIPTEYADADVMIVYSNDKGQITVYETKRDAGYAYADVDYIRNFGLVGARLDEEANNRFDLIRLLTAGAVVLAGIGIGLIVMTRRKKR